MLKRRLDGKTLGTLFVLLLSLCVSAVAQTSSDEWTLNPSDYRYDMSLYFSLASDEYENLDLYEIGAFYGDECRGVAEKLDLPNGESRLYMRVRSNAASGETLSMVLRDKKTGATYPIKNAEGRELAFHADEMLGTPSQPYELYVFFNVAIATDGRGTVAFENGEYAAGTIIKLTATPNEGYHFDKWSDGSTEATVQITVNSNIDLTAQFAPNIYNAVFKIDGATVATLEVTYADPVPSPEAPAKEGYMFAGWSDIPATMPAHDIEVNGAYIPSLYNAVFSIDGEVVAALNFATDAAITAPEAPEKIGYTFNGWDNLPATMPATNIEITGSYSVNSYYLTFIIGEEQIAKSLVAFGSPVTAPEAPAKEGYTFAGWQNMPETMPARDLDVTGEYKPMAYNVNFIIDGEVASSQQVVFGTEIVTPKAPGKEGYTFDGWKDVPATMPGQDIDIIGSYSVNTYKATFSISGELVAEMEVVYNTAVAAPEAPAKEGYTFTGWQNIPETMPPFDITIEGNYAVNTYNAYFVIDDTTVSPVPVDFGAAIPVPEAPVKEGYTFDGWKDVPATMPATDITISGSYTINTYKAIFTVDGEVVATFDVEYNSAVPTPETPAKDGYTFTGWQNIPETMPPFDIEILATYDVKAYNVTFKIDGEVFAFGAVDFGAPIVIPEASVKEGYTFTGWQNVPETMPAQDIEINGSYSIDIHKAIFKIDGEEIATIDVEYNSAVVAPEAPAKEGYTFTGWQNIPETMPPFDVEILGTYSANTYSASFKIDDEVVAVLSVDYGTAINAPVAPDKEGYIFDGWQNLPETMPAHDIEIEGSYSEDPNAPVIKTFTVTFKVDDEVIAMFPVEEGSVIAAPEVPTKEGHTFTGWQNMPETMPAQDIEITGSYAADTYKASFTIDGEVVATVDVVYNTAVEAPEVAAKEGYTFTGWQNIPETMPPFDIEIQGVYVVNSYTATYKIDGEVFASAVFDFGTQIAVPEAPVMEGHTFSGWQNIPETMPAQDIEINGSYAVNTYKASFSIDGEVIATSDVEYNTTVVAPEAPAKEGYTFTGWQNIPETMPPFDVQILGTYTVNTYNVTFIIDDDMVSVLPFDFGATIIAPEAPIKEGHTFGGWQNLPETMPNEDITVSGSYTTDIYKATFTIDGEVIATSDVEYNTTVVAPEAPAKEGYTFTGWQNIPETMPPFDVEITGTYAVNTYVMTFAIGEEVVAEVPFDFGATIVAPEAPAKEGHTFAGWANVPEAMPATNITVNGSYTVNSYTVKYLIDNEVVSEISVEYGAAIPTVVAPEKEGRSFNGWENVPATMPAADIDIYGAYVMNTYTVTFRIGDELIAALRVNYGAAIQAPEAPAREGLTFNGWENVPETMPAEDLVINGSYEVNKYILTIYLNNEVYSREEVTYGTKLEISQPELPENMEFVGWISEIPETMPAADVDIYGEMKEKTTTFAEFITGDKQTLTIYTLNGVLLFNEITPADAQKRLTPGFYIINGEKVMVP